MIPAGHEEQFRAMFAQEADQRLASLSRHLLALEEASGDDELIASVFRDAHNLKGVAAVVGLDDVARVAHAMEDLLERLRSKERLVTPGVVDVLLAATDGLVVMIPAVLAGEDQSAAAEALEHRIRLVVEHPEAAPAPAAEAPAGPAGAAPAVAPAARPDDRAGETLLVPVSRLDELVRLVGESASANLRLGRLLSERLAVNPGTLAEFRDLSRTLNDLQERTMRARMVPVATITEPLRRAVRDLARSLGKQVRWEDRGTDTELDRSVLQQLADPLLHLVRNAVDHGLESPAERAAAGKPPVASLVLQAMQLGSEVILDVTDDGRGIDVQVVRDRAAAMGTDTSTMDDAAAIMLVFTSGFSTASVISDVSGRGVGLDAVRVGVEAVRGRVEVHSTPGQGTRFRFVVPITLAVLSCLLVEVGRERYAIPMHSVVVAQAADALARAHVDGRPMVWVGDAALPVSGLGRTLWGPSRPDGGEVVVVVSSTRRHAFLVDRLLGQRDVVVKGVSRLVPRLDLLAGASVEPDGSILLVLDAAGLVEQARTDRTPTIDVAPAAAPATSPAVAGTPVSSAVSVLVVDDAAIIRHLERSILERAGYLVRTANDGVEALARLAEERCDLVITDLEMPRMDGFALTKAIRADTRFSNTPVLIITSRASDESRERGLEAGADSYIVKAAFDETALLGAVSRLVGRST